MRKMYAFNDQHSEETYTPVHSDAQAKELNEKGYGIFWTVNSFRGARKIDNLQHIHSWYVDLDDQKEPLKDLLNRGILPSMVVETKRGYHLYFDAKNATMLNYKRINLRLLQAFGGDTSVHDVARLLRVPGYLHQKDPANPFLIKTVYMLNVQYSENQMLYFFPPHESELVREEKKVFKRPEGLEGNDYFDKVHRADQETLLGLISGKSCVNGERYSFTRVGGGKRAIRVNGKGTACWIDSQGRIGSFSGGGPSVWEWLQWYGYKHQEIKEILMREVGEL